MGNFYVNITTRKADAEAILQYLKSRDLSAFIAKGPEDYCTIYEERCDEQDTRHITSLLKEISSQLNCAAIGMLNHDDDILAYELWLNGEKVDEYDSCPGYFQGDERRMEPEGGNAELLSKLMGNGKNVEAIQVALRKSGSGEEGFVFAIERHEALAKAIGLPLHTVGYGFRYISEGEMPEGIQPENIIKSHG
jgi:hypothetical protein